MTHHHTNRTAKMASGLLLVLSSRLKSDCLNSMNQFSMAQCYVRKFAYAKHFMFILEWTLFMKIKNVSLPLSNTLGFGLSLKIKYLLLTHSALKWNL